MLDGIIDKLAATDESTAKRETRAKRVAKERVAETTAEAFNRIRTLKLDDAERLIVDDVERLVGNGSVTLAAGKLSKKAVFEAWKSWNVLERERLKKRVVAERPDNYWIVTDVIMLNRVKALIAENDVIAVDTETTGLDLFNDVMCGWSAYFPKNDIAVYVSFRHTNGVKYDGDRTAAGLYEWLERNRRTDQVDVKSALDVLRTIVEDTSKTTVFHNLKYDGHIMLNDGITLKNGRYDTMSAGKLLNELEESHSLKALYVKYVTGGMDEKVTFKMLFDDATIYDKDILLSGIYAAKDALMTYKLYEFQKPFIDTRDNLKTVWYDIEQKLLPVDLRLERTGFRLDVEHFERLQAGFSEIVESTKAALYAAFDLPETFNVNSNQQLGWLIYDKLGVDPDFPKKFRKASRSLAKDVVDAMCDDLPELAPLLEYRKALKMLQFAEKLPRSIEPATGRIHCRFNNMNGDDFNSTGAASGRYSSSEYCAEKHSRTGDVKKGFNSQQLPSRGGIRQGFIPDDGWIFVGADLSQIEPRIIAHILFTQHGDPSMKMIYDAGVDLYTTMAMKTFSLPEAYCIDKAWYDPASQTGGYGGFIPPTAYFPRAVMKTGVLAALYGQSPFSFSRVVNVSLEIAQTFFDGLANAFPGLKPLRESTIKSLRTGGSVAFSETEYGHKRRYPDYRKRRANLDALQRKCYEDGLTLLLQRRPKSRVRDGQQDDSMGVIYDKRVAKIPLTADDIEAVTRLGLYVKNGSSKDDFWTWRKYCSAVERESVNHRIQGTAANVIKLIMIATDEWCVDHGYKFHLTLHDEQMVSLPISQLTESTIADVNRLMTETVKLSVPIKTDIVIMRRWMDETKPADWDYVNGRPLKECDAL